MAEKQWSFTCFSFLSILACFSFLAILACFSFLLILACFSFLLILACFSIAMLVYHCDAKIKVTNMGSWSAQIGY